MKKNCYLFWEKVQKRKRKRLFFILLTISFSLFFVFRLSATGYSQETILSLSIEDKTVKEVINYLEEKTPQKKYTGRPLTTPTLSGKGYQCESL